MISCRVFAVAAILAVGSWTWMNVEAQTDIISTFISSITALLATNPPGTNNMCANPDVLRVKVTTCASQNLPLNPLGFTTCVSTACQIPIEILAGGFGGTLALASLLGVNFFTLVNTLGLGVVFGGLIPTFGFGR